MNKKIMSILFAIFLCLCIAVPGLAITEGETSGTQIATEQTAESSGFVDEYERVQDFAKVLTSEELANLNAEFDEISYKHNVDITLCFTNTLDGMTVSDYAEGLYESLEYGYGEEKDGVILVISFEDRDWYMATSGYAIKVFTDSGIQYIGNQITDDLAYENYFEAAGCFAQTCDEFLTDAQNGIIHDNDELITGDSDSVFPPLMWIIISLGVGLVVAFIVVGKMKSKLKTVKMQSSARNYQKSGSLNITESNDIFLYSNVTRTPKPKNNGNSSGSSTHTSSSGHTYGGGGGKF